MSGPGASSSEMPGFPCSGWADPELDEHLLDTILAGQHLVPDAPVQAHVVAEMLASLVGPAGPGELGGEAAARAAFAHAASIAGISPAARRPARRKPSWRAAPIKGRLAGVLVAAMVGLGGTAAAYAGVLPSPIQNLAHHVIGAPASHRASADARDRRQASHRLCLSYERAKTHHDAGALASAAHRLAIVAGNPGKIDAYCAAVVRSAAAAPSAHPAGRHGPHPGKAHGKAKAPRQGQGPRQGRTRAWRTGAPTSRAAGAASPAATTPV